MFGGAAKRSSDDNILSSAKKKKIFKEKHDADVPKSKTTPVDDGDLRQKKAFFAYFGKKFDSKKNDECSVGVNLKMPAVKNGKMNNVIVEQRDTPRPINNSFIKINANLPYVSSFIEELGCFPKITHANWLAPLSRSNLNLRLNQEILNETKIENSMLSFQILNSVSEQLVLEPYQMNINLPSMISSFKKSTPNFPVVDFQKYLKKNHMTAKKSASDIEIMWIDKYKPMSKEEVLGNNKIVKDFKTWLEPKKKNSNKLKKAKSYDDDDDFIFDSDSNSSHQAQRNLAILLGPSGCGKTSTVYAVANELNANVIELNASCNRNGKRIITDLMEATQSHAVEKNCLLNMLKEKNKKPKNAKKKSKITIKKSDSNKKMTIILIEDADIFFENYDDGFLSAISTLATDSKRPLVLTANDPFSNNLLKFFSSNEIVFNFVRPPKKHLNCFLQLMALNEGVIMSEDEIDSFVHPVKPDIRQSILQLQYIISSGELNQKTHKCSFKKYINSIWWNWPHVIGCDSDSIENNKQPKSNTNIETVCQHLDSMSKLNLIYSKTQSYEYLDPQPFWYNLVKRDSASLIETNQWSDNSIELSTDITQWIHNHISKPKNIAGNLYPLTEKLSHRKRIWDTSRNLLEQIGLDYCNRKNETCFDYMASIRSLGQHHQVGNLRHSKMFSYLQRINIELDCKDLKYFCESLRTSPNSEQPTEVLD